MTVILIVIGALGTVPKGIERGLEELAEIDRNTEKSPRDLRKLVSQILADKLTLL